jgi:hypothetical protein
LVEFPVEDGGSVLVEVSSASSSSPVLRGLGGRDVVEKAQCTIEAAVGRVQPAASAIITQLRGMAQSPDEVQLEFGISLHAEAGAFVASASSSANFTVTLHWRRP